uniref:Uncharacterized protein n=1 Tax=Melopsittacus undulatus TaxID=13146 RepID=A0A8C6JBQ0_MELUD
HFVGLPKSLNTEVHKVLNLKHRLSRLKGGNFSCFYFFSSQSKVDFASALASCEDARGTLATPMNEEENKAILGIVKEYNQYAYLGIKIGEDAGQFKYLNGIPVNYTKWYQNEPNGKRTEKCVEMYNDGSWNDKKCNLRRLTICEF